MTLKKSIAIWKYKSGTQGITELMENNYKDMTLLRFGQTMKKHIKTQNMLSFLALREHACQKMITIGDRKARMQTMHSADGGKFFKNYSSEFNKLHRKNTSNFSNKNLFDVNIKVWLVLKKFLKRRQCREQTLAFTFWRQYCIQYNERLKLTMNRLSQTNPNNFTLIQTLAVAHTQLGGVEDHPGSTTAQ